MEFMKMKRRTSLRGSAALGSAVAAGRIFSFASGKSASRSSQSSTAPVGVSGSTPFEANGVMLPDEGWRLWPDTKAEWRNDDIFLPEEVDVARLPKPGTASLSRQRSRIRRIASNRRQGSALLGRFSFSYLNPNPTPITRSPYRRKVGGSNPLPASNHACRSWRGLFHFSNMCVIRPGSRIEFSVGRAMNARIPARFWESQAVLECSNPDTPLQPCTPRMPGVGSPLYWSVSRPPTTSLLPVSLPCGTRYDARN